MNVRCPSCETLYRVDPAKVPAEGVRASCVTCGAVFLVSRRTSDEVTAPTPAEPVDVPAPHDLASSPTPAAEPDAREPEVVEQVAGESEVAPQTPDIAPAFEVPDEPAVPQYPEPEVLVAPPPELPDIEPPAPTVEPTPPQPAAATEETEPARVPEAESPEAEPPAPTGAAHFELETPPETPIPQVPVEEAPKPRFSRPFIQPRADSVAEPEAPVAPPMRPSAPVFRPTPGMPVRTPPIPDAPPKAATPVAPIAPASPPSAPVEPPATAPKRPVNPFLSRDPNQKARRLARALVSDMIVYQPKKRQDALEAGTLKEEFDEEIKKSWEEYVQQVGEELAESTDFFKEALNDILAGGRQVF